MSTPNSTTSERGTFSAAVDPLDLPEAVRWEPWKDKDHPELFRGAVVKKYQQYSDYAKDDPLRNFIDVLDGDANCVWTLSG